MKPVQATALLLLLVNDAIWHLLSLWRRGLMAADTVESRLVLYLLHPWHMGLQKVSFFLDRYAFGRPKTEDDT